MIDHWHLPSPQTKTIYYNRFDRTPVFSCSPKGKHLWTAPVFSKMTSVAIVMDMWLWVKQQCMNMTTQAWPLLLCLAIGSIPGYMRKSVSAGEKLRRQRTPAASCKAFSVSIDCRLSDTMSWAWRRQLQLQTDVSQERCEHKTHDSLGIMSLGRCACGLACVCGHCKSKYVWIYTAHMCSMFMLTVCIMYRPLIMNASVCTMCLRLHVCLLIECLRICVHSVSQNYRTHEELSLSAAFQGISSTLWAYCQHIWCCTTCNIETSEELICFKWKIQAPGVVLNVHWQWVYNSSHRHNASVTHYSVFLHSCCWICICIVSMCYR